MSSVGLINDIWQENLISRVRKYISICNIVIIYNICIIYIYIIYIYNIYNIYIYVLYYIYIIYIILHCHSLLEMNR